MPSLLVLMCVGASYRLLGDVSQIDARYGWLYPLGAAAFVWAMLRSMVTVLARRGVVWRGTFYGWRGAAAAQQSEAVERNAPVEAGSC